jgi:hypothetical protein
VAQATRTERGALGWGGFTCCGDCAGYPRAGNALAGPKPFLPGSDGTQKGARFAGSSVVNRCSTGRLNLISGRETPLTDEIHWDVKSYDASGDGLVIGLVPNAGVRSRTH